MIHDLLCVPRLVSLDATEERSHPCLQEQGPQRARLLCLPGQGHQVQHRAVKPIVAVEPLGLVREGLCEPFPSPVGIEVLCRAEDAIVWKSDPAVSAHQFHSVGAAQFGQYVAYRLARGKTFHHQRAQVPREAFLAQRGGDAPDSVGLLKYVHLATIAGEVSPGC